MIITGHPEYKDGHKVGKPHTWFAWYPVMLWYGQYAWLRRVSRMRVSVRGEEFWSYSDP